MCSAVLNNVPCAVFGVQVVEIPSLTEHLLTECDRQDVFGKCWRCSEAILKEELSRHIKTKGCNRECLLGPLPSHLDALGRPSHRPGFRSAPARPSAGTSCLLPLVKTHRSN